MFKKKSTVKRLIGEYAQVTEIPNCIATLNSYSSSDFVLFFRWQRMSSVSPVTEVNPVSTDNDERVKQL